MRGSQRNRIPERHHRRILRIVNAAATVVMLAGRIHSVGECLSLSLGQISQGRGAATTSAFAGSFDAFFLSNRS